MLNILKIVIKMYVKVLLKHYCSLKQIQNGFSTTLRVFTISQLAKKYVYLDTYIYNTLKSIVNFNEISKLNVIIIFV